MLSELGREIHFEGPLFISFYDGQRGNFLTPAGNRDRESFFQIYGIPESELIQEPPLTLYYFYGNFSYSTILHYK